MNSNVFALALLSLSLPFCMSSLALAAGIPADSASLLGTWEGSFAIGPRGYVLAFTISGEQGNFAATFTSKDMGIYGMPADSITVENNHVTIKVRPVDGEFNGTLRVDSQGAGYIGIDGDWFQQSEMIPLNLRPAEKP